jgi:hypothetical protein
MSSRDVTVPASNRRPDIARLSVTALNNCDWNCVLSPSTNAMQSRAMQAWIAIERASPGRWNGKRRAAAKISGVSGAHSM